jgi:hypothetical protein
VLVSFKSIVLAEEVQMLTIPTENITNSVESIAIPAEPALQPDIYITKTASIASGNEGASITYILTYGNQ